jgi:hypothetical protein
MSSLHEAAREAAEEINYCTDADVFEYYCAEDAAIIERHFAAYPWVSVKERLPEGRSLTFTPTVDDAMRYRVVPGGLSRLATDVTHWMPLPAPPSEVTK